MADSAQEYDIFVRQIGGACPPDERSCREGTLSSAETGLPERRTATILTALDHTPRHVRQFNDLHDEAKQCVELLESSKNRKVESIIVTIAAEQSMENDCSMS